MRLTHLTEQKDKRKNREPMLKIRNKLFELENIEDELGIDLITLFKALKKGFWFKRGEKDLCFACKQKHLELKLAGDDGNTIWFKINSKGRIIQLKDYGKTWALTRKELL